MEQFIATLVISGTTLAGLCSLLGFGIGRAIDLFRIFVLGGKR